MYKIILWVFLAIIGISCTTSNNLSRRQPFARMIDTSEVFAHNFTGMAIYDPTAKKAIFERNADRYFTPASNTKLFTFYACLKTLGDSIPALRYTINKDSLIFWGTGDPTFFHHDLKSTKAFNFLKSQKGTKNLFFSDGNFTNQPMGEGWAWDDYNDYYSAEIYGLPMYGNVIRVSIDKGTFAPQPAIFSNSFYRKDEGSSIKRIQTDNIFVLPKSTLQKNNYKTDIPFKTSSALTQQLLMDTLRKNVSLLHVPVPKDARTIYSMASEDVYRLMMQESDNMLAEHLLLLCGAVLKDSLNTAFAIKSVTEKHLQDLPDAPKWVDGSGLSRYNLFTPRSIVKLLEKISAEMPQEKLYTILPAGGQTGTLKNVFKSTGKPFIFAKTGTLGGVYNLSGYLVTKKGKTLIVSLMNNNFNLPASKIRREAEKVLTWVYEHY
ncbi:D-alanyl-D-alanine carboxypeptidase/D-alanyl-D-alanine-endopeptidase [Emticicia sp. 21SJ11W-3]|uniref:D-alanyl-D-alanine carboxypeptidase/D-alanyl-D-alanine-endopeptidase n=1 Tax=Emticicia sp. 21SJ11W-3 TaxID=2916755 RepID=UPI00209CACC1|nr:D-alanyl-D-alanine carboxypeptidase [Emticicia sp. 21SJ11W-3]UTA68533.1 D-alanyl-D-alanine carboxypeptidase [Emticicia sp. 21SJ11W-3]